MTAQMMFGSVKTNIKTKSLVKANVTLVQQPLDDLQC